ncbi:MAG: hypothetical protein HUU50_02610 [Candidatus Brocadiae bacterium]|nr:hypothetical protein [Candidatus Brocadiia bacterium]
MPRLASLVAPDSASISFIKPFVLYPFAPLATVLSSDKKIPFISLERLDAFSRTPLNCASKAETTFVLLLIFSIA